MQLLVNEVLTDIGIQTLEGSSKQRIHTNVFSPHNGGSILVIGPIWLFGCCGANDMTGMDYNFKSEEQKQSFVWRLYRTVNFSQTYYMIAATYQLEAKAPPYYTEPLQFGNTITLLRELGAREVDASPNRNHGPNNMHLHVWAPNRTDEGWSKYIDPHTGNPLWFHKLDKRVQQRLIDESLPKLKQLEEKRRSAREILVKQREAQRKQDWEYQIQVGIMDESLAKLGWSKKDGTKTNISTGSTVRFATDSIWKA